jgi:hypothetical protein
MKTILSAVTTLGLLLVLGWCVFGFLASTELADPAQRLPWQVGYAALGLVCATRALLPVLRRRLPMLRRRRSAGRS